MTAKSQASPWEQQRHRILRQVSSALIFGVALLYTMEVWWAGITAGLWKLLLFLIFTFIANVFLGYFSGFNKRHSLMANVFEAVNAFAIGLPLAALCLFILGRLHFHDPWDIIIGKTLALAVPFSLGAFLADTILPFLSRRQSQGPPSDLQRPGSNALGQTTLADTGATLAGGIFIGFPIVATEEVQLLALELQTWYELAVIVFSLLCSYLIVFAAQEKEQGSGQSQVFLQKPIPETTFCYGVSLLLSFFLLVLYGQVELGQSPLSTVVSQVLILALPITIGGAAGRLAV